MAKYTTQLRTVIANQNDEWQLFDFHYPIFDENYRPILEAKIQDRFYFREIGFETVGMFKHYLRTTLNEIMPYFNQLYLSQLITVDPLVTHRINESLTRTNTGTAEAESESSTSGNEVFSDTPQGKLSNVSDYATNITDNKGASEGKSTQTVNNVETFIRELTGNNSSKSDAQLVAEYRNALINVDELLLNRLNSLFMLIY